MWLNDVFVPGSSAREKALLERLGRAVELGHHAGAPLVHVALLQASEPAVLALHHALEQVLLAVHQIAVPGRLEAPNGHAQVIVGARAQMVTSSVKVL